MLIRFDSVEAARAAHDSAAYQEALRALDGGAVRDMRIVPGVDYPSRARRARARQAPARLIRATGPGPT